MQEEGLACRLCRWREDWRLSLQGSEAVRRNADVEARNVVAALPSAV